MIVNQIKPTEVSAVIDYAKYLKLRKIPYKQIDPVYYQIGTPKTSQGWMIHVSIVKREIENAIKILIPILHRKNVPFKLVKNVSIATQILEGNLGYENLGKLIVIYTKDANNAVELATELIEITKPFSGPAVPTDYHLGSTIYTRYGAFINQLGMSAKGEIGDCVLDSNGNLVKDEANIPFRLPSGRDWPFKTVKEYTPETDLKFLANRYLITNKIKSDAKGNVYKSFRVKGLNITRSIVKEGFHDMCSDQSGRDIRDRLRWQFDVQHSLFRELHVPKPYDLIEDTRGAYLCMEYVKGTSLSDEIDRLHNGHGWITLANEIKLRLIDLAANVVECIRALHKCGYVHRDIAPNNFLVTASGRIFLLDLELTYLVSRAQPQPPFQLGTPGYIAPEQFAGDKPTFLVDSFGIGALLIFIITNLSPVKFATRDRRLLNEQLLAITEEKEISEIISLCLAEDPMLRPSLEQIVNTLRNTGLTCVRLNNHDLTASHYMPDLNDAINAASESLASPFFKDERGIWMYPTLKREMHVSNQQQGVATITGLSGGLAGTLYLMSKLNKISNTLQSDTFKCNLAFLRRSVGANEINRQSKDLENGVAGILLTFVSLAPSIRPSLDSEMKRMSEYLSETDDNDVSLKHGLAGIGLALLHYAMLSGDGSARQQTDRITAKIISKQEIDGSWKIDDETFTGIEQGVAGILVYLLTVYKTNQDIFVYTSIVGGLNWLTKQCRIINGTETWYVSNKCRKVSPWFIDGITGIAYCFILASRTLNDNQYLKYAARALKFHPQSIVCNSFSLLRGITGIGEVLIEMYNETHENIWWDRAQWIAKVLVYSRRKERTIWYWKMETNDNPSPALMTGNSGLLHFLHRAANPKSLSFPIYN